VPNRNRQFPHLLAPDIDLWERFLAANPDRFKAYEYDIRVGAGRDPGADTPENIRGMALDLSQRRIDAIGYTPNDITIIEITCSAGLRAVGQMLAYPHLYRMTHSPTAPIKILLVASEIQTDMIPVLNTLKIPFEVYPE
jgi:hypothetical protein